MTKLSGYLSSSLEPLKPSFGSHLTSLKGVRFGLLSHRDFFEKHSSRGRKRNPKPSKSSGIVLYQYHGFRYTQGQFTGSLVQSARLIGFGQLLLHYLNIIIRNVNDYATQKNTTIVSVSPFILVSF